MLRLTVQVEAAQDGRAARIRCAACNDGPYTRQTWARTHAPSCPGTQERKRQNVEAEQRLLKKPRRAEASRGEAGKPDQGAGASAGELAEHAGESLSPDRPEGGQPGSQLSAGVHMAGSDSEASEERGSGSAGSSACSRGGPGQEFDPGHDAADSWQDYEPGNNAGDSRAAAREDGASGLRDDTGAASGQGESGPGARDAGRLREPDLDDNGRGGHDSQQMISHYGSFSSSRGGQLEDDPGALLDDGDGGDAAHQQGQEDEDWSESGSESGQPGEGVARPEGGGGDDDGERARSGRTTRPGRLAAAARASQIRQQAAAMRETLHMQQRRMRGARGQRLGGLCGATTGCTRRARTPAG